MVLALEYSTDTLLNHIERTVQNSQTRQLQALYTYSTSVSVPAKTLKVIDNIAKCKKHFIKMLKDVGMVVPKIKGTRL